MYSLDFEKEIIYPYNVYFVVLFILYHYFLFLFLLWFSKTSHTKNCFTWSYLLWCHLMPTELHKINGEIFQIYFYLIHIIFNLIYRWWRWHYIISWCGYWCWPDNTKAPVQSFIGRIRKIKIGFTNSQRQASCFQGNFEYWK